MKITTNHPSSSYGVPVILDDRGCPLDYADGVKAFRKLTGISAEDLAAACGVAVGNVYNWQSGVRPPSAAALNVMADLLRSREALES